MLIRCVVLAVGLLCFVGMPILAFAQEAGETRVAEKSDGAWKPLFDGKSLEGWYTQIQNLKKNDDPEKFFHVEDGVIHVYKDQAEGTKVPNGFIATEKEYSSFDLRMEFKWGTKKFKPRMMAVRDAGLLYHVRPPDVVWPRSVECQIQEGDVGDCFTVRGARLTTSVEDAAIKTPSGVKTLPRYKAEKDGGETRTLGNSGIQRIVKSSMVERDGWNVIEVAVRGSESAEHIVNGKTVCRARDLKELKPGDALADKSKPGAAESDWVPLSRGRIALQCEYAEVFYRRIEIREIATSE